MIFPENNVNLSQMITTWSFNLKLDSSSLTLTLILLLKLFVHWIQTKLTVAVESQYAF